MGFRSVAEEQIFPGQRTLRFEVLRHGVVDVGCRGDADADSDAPDGDAVAATVSHVVANKGNARGLLCRCSEEPWPYEHVHDNTGNAH